MLRSSHNGCGSRSDTGLAESETRFQQYVKFHAAELQHTLVLLGHRMNYGRHLQNHSGIHSSTSCTSLPPCNLPTNAVTVPSHRGPQLVRCGPATIAPAAPAPRPSLLYQFIACVRGNWPTSQSIRVLLPSSLAGVRDLGSWVLGFMALSPGHFTLVLSPGRGVHSGYHVWSTCALVMLAVAGLSWPHSRCSVCLQGHGGLTV